MPETTYRLTDLHQQAHRFVLLSGCSGGGKSTLLAELAGRAFPVVDEPGRQVVKELRRTYLRLGYTLVELPRSDVDSRCRFVLDRQRECNVPTVVGMSNSHREHPAARSRRTRW